MTALWDILRQQVPLPSSSDIELPAEAVSTLYAAMGAYIHSDLDRLWNEPRVGEDQCDADRLCIAVAERFHFFFSAFGEKKIKSPIEARLLAALLWLEVEWAGLPRLDLTGEFAIPSDGEGSLSYYITPQAQIGRYKADFLIWFELGDARAGIVVECDGHAFHERTKEQAAHDKKRDRELLTEGYPVARFTGSEIFRDAIGCADQLRDMLFAVLERVTNEGSN